MRNILIRLAIVIVLIASIVLAIRRYSTKTTRVVEISFCDNRSPVIDSVRSLSWIYNDNDAVMITTYRQAMPVFFTRNMQYINVCSVKILRRREWR